MTSFRKKFRQALAISMVLCTLLTFLPGSPLMASAAASNETNGYSIEYDRVAGRVSFVFDAPLSAAPSAGDFWVDFNTSIAPFIKQYHISDSTMQWDNAGKVSFQLIAPPAQLQDITFNLYVSYTSATKEKISRTYTETIPAVTGGNAPAVTNQKLVVANNPGSEPYVKCQLDLLYDYASPDGVAEGSTAIEWWASPIGNPNGEYIKLEGIRTKDLLTIGYYRDRYIKARITPKDANGREGAVVETAPIGPIVQDPKINPEVIWFRDAGYGLMFHFMHDYVWLAASNDAERVGANEKWYDYMTSFDVDAFVKDVEDAGAGFVILTIGQHDGFYNAYNPVYDEYAGVREGERTPPSTARDLPMDIAKALHAKGIKFILYATASPPKRAHLNFYDGFNASASGYMKGDYYITERFGLTTHDDMVLTQDNLRKWTEVLGYWSERYGEYLDGWWLDGMWKTENSLYNPSNTYDILPDLTPNPNAKKDGAWAASKQWNWHTWVSALKAGNPDRIISCSQGGSQNVNVPYEDFVGGEGGSSTTFNPTVRPPRNPEKNSVNGWVDTGLGVNWFFMGGMGKSISMYDIWGQGGVSSGITKERAALTVKNITGLGGVTVVDGKVNRFGRIDPDQLNIWRAVKAVVRDGDPLPKMTTYDHYLHMIKYLDKDGNDNTDWTYSSSNHTTSKDGSYVEFDFYGTGVTVYAAKGRTYGDVDIYIDDMTTPAATVNAYYTSTQSSVALYTNDQLDFGKHKVRVVNRFTRGGESVETSSLAFTKFVITTRDPDLVDKTTATFDIAPGKHEDIVLNLMDLDKGFLPTGVKYNGTALVSGKDFVIGETTLTIKKEFLATLPLEDVTLVLYFTEGFMKNFVVSVIDSAHKNSVITPDAATYEKNAPTSILIDIELNGNELLGILNGAASLEKGRDYISYGTGVLIRPTWLDTLAVGSTKLNFMFNNGNTTKSQILTITVSNAESGMVNNTDPSVKYYNSAGGTTGWYASSNRSADSSGVYDYNRDVQYATTNGNYFEFSFEGTSVGFITEVSNSMGMIQFYLDGKDVGIVDCRTVRNPAYPLIRYQQTVLSLKDLEPGAHVLKGVKVDGTYMYVDAFRIDSDSMLATSYAEFNKDAPSDVRVGWSLNRNRLVSITNGDNALVEDQDYIATQDSIIILSEYLGKQSVGTTRLAFAFGAGAGQILNIAVTDANSRLDVTVNPGTIVSTLAAYINVDVAGLNGRNAVAYLAKDGAAISDKFPVSGGKARIYTAAAPEAGSYDIVAEAYSEDQAVVASGKGLIRVLQYNTNIWEANALIQDGKLHIVFNDDVALKSSANCVTISGKAYSAKVLEDNRAVEVLGFDADASEGAITAVVKGVKYPALFPSYSFTFTVTCAK